ncbi:MAG: hypothetical protein B7Y44_00665 [Sphingomonadales bacterium 28-55-16]|nr:MAG: hypothetical protein B7Y44_00665 [Sphingomonadales bacterium 28-55-16]
MISFMMRSVSVRIMMIFDNAGRHRTTTPNTPQAQQGVDNSRLHIAQHDLGAPLRHAQDRLSVIFRG